MLYTVEIAPPTANDSDRRAVIRFRYISGIVSRRATWKRVEKLKSRLSSMHTGNRYTWTRHIIYTVAGTVTEFRIR